MCRLLLLLPLLLLLHQTLHHLPANGTAERWCALSCCS
jgi:hypothetical protein